VQDFEMFVKDSGYEATGGMVSLDKTGWIRQGATWKKPGFKQGPTDPLVGVSWDDAKEFCKWLTKREHEDGGLIEGLCYRLPSDEEWSVAVGLKNEVAKTPEEKMNSSTNMLYPWGSEWPPPVGAGNYCGEESRIGNEPESWDVIQGYNDGYPRTSPVGSFASDKNSAASIQNASNAMTMYSTNFACYDNSASSKR
jgi:formylglycine-generating enzyme required for sulfatase activity